MTKYCIHIGNKLIIVFKILGQHNFGWIVGSGCTCGQAEWGASLSLSNIFASLVVVNLRPKHFWWPHQKGDTIVLVLWDLHSVTLPKWLSRYDPTRYIKCILVVSLCHCIWSGVFQVFQTISWTTELFKFAIFFLSSWNREILEVSWFEIERNNFLDFTPTKGVEENCCIINCKYFQGFKRKTGRLESFKMTSLDRRNVGIQYSDGALFIYFILSFTSVYSFIGLFDAYPIVDIKPV